MYEGNVKEGEDKGEGREEREKREGGEGDSMEKGEI